MVDRRLISGCWIESKRFGPAVLIAIEDGFFSLRYKAIHMASQQIIWVVSGDNDVTFLRPADDQSRSVLALEGPYGLGPDRSDPRMPPVK